MNFKYFSKNGELLKIQDATIPLQNIAYAYGFGVYETIRVSNGVVFFMEQHVARLLRSAAIIRLEHLLVPYTVTNHIASLVAVLTEQTYNLKIVLIGGANVTDAELYIYPTAPLFPTKAMYRDGIKTITVNYERMFPQAKSLNMLGSYLAYRNAHRLGCYDALLVNSKGCVTEGTRTNFFAMQGTTIISPPLTTVLEGVTRTALLKVASEHGYTIVEEPLPLEELHTFDGAFITSTSSNILPVKEINNVTYGSIPQPLKNLMTHYDQFRRSCGGLLREHAL